MFILMWGIRFVLSSVFFIQMTVSVLIGHDSICKRHLKCDYRIANVQVVLSEREMK